MLERFKLLLRLQEKEGIVKRNIKHLAITTHGIEKWTQENKKPLEETYKKSFEMIKQVIELQINNKIPILTIYLLPEKLKKEEEFPKFLDAFIEFFTMLKSSSLVHENKVKVSALGKWYDIPGRAVEPIKLIIEDTKDYDSFFVNFCINYDGQEEIVDACKLLARQIKAGKVDIDNITKEIIKNNIYSSYFLPPDLMIKNGKLKTTSGLLLWDSVNAEIYFTSKNWPDFTAADFTAAVKTYTTE